jgi:hypothetical protein
MTHVYVKLVLVQVGGLEFVIRLPLAIQLAAASANPPAPRCDDRSLPGTPDLMRTQ